MFDEWKNKDLHQNQLFITDGIIDREIWSKSNDGVMFLLKEAYDSKRTEGSWDLPSLIKKRGVSGRTFKPMAQWAYGIQKVIQNKEISPYIQNNDQVQKALFSSAIVNLKKSGGRKKSGIKNLEKYVDEDWKLIYEQISGIAPKIIVCGNTWSLIKGKLIHKTKVSDCAFLSNGILYIDYWHPSNRASNKMNYYSICAIVQQALKATDSEL